jgi:hypothetical protein
MEYKVIEMYYGGEGQRERFEWEVNEMIRKGWRPQGGVSISHNPNAFKISYAQAMVK